MTIAPYYLEISNLSCRRGGKVLLQGLSFGVNSGQIIWIEGGNGSGKTTLMRCCCGLIDEFDGKIIWHGKDLDRYSWYDFKKEFTYIGHRLGLSDYLTVIENLQLLATLHGHYRSLDLLSVLKQLGLESLAHHKVITLSAGQRKRVSLARLLIEESTFWLLDEPFVAVDQLAINLLEECILKHLQSGGAVLLTSHQPIEIAGCAVDRIQLPEPIYEGVLNEK